MEPQVEIKAFLYDLKKIKSELIPGAVVNGFRDTAQKARNAVVDRTRSIFNLHSEYIPNATMFMPDKPNQVRAAIKAFGGRHKDFEASVFLRGSNDPKKSLEFMVPHETGGPKISHFDSTVAVPARGLESYRFKTGKGRTKKMWKPEQLLKYYNEAGPATKGHKWHGSGKGKPKAFVLEHNGRTMIVRRKTPKTRELEVLYLLHDQTQIQKRYKFVNTVHRVVRQSLMSDVGTRFRALRLR